MLIFGNSFLPQIVGLRKQAIVKTINSVANGSPESVVEEIIVRVKSQDTNAVCRLFFFRS